MRLETALFLLPGLLIGITLHEMAHALAARWLGDSCAARQGRVSLNPFRHLSFWGTMALFVLGFGWGKPVPVNLYNFRHPKRDFLLTSLAGPAANILLCAISLGIVYLHPPYLMDVLFRSIFIINAIMAVFNLLPIPPLDGSRIWPCLIPGMRPVASGKWTMIWMAILLYAVYTGKTSMVIQPVIESSFRLLPMRTMEPVPMERPENFPIELQAPGSCPAWYWIIPEDAADPNLFVVSFESKPTLANQELKSFLRGNLSRQGWRQVTFNPDDPSNPPATDWLMEQDEDDPNVVNRYWLESWFKPDRGLAVIRFEQYLSDPNNLSDPTDSGTAIIFVEMHTPISKPYKDYLATQGINDIK